MLSYLHGFHAGNHADILKHFVLFYTLEYLNKKNKPYSIFDTHSGSALYNLSDQKALKTGEAARGIQKLLAVPGSRIPPALTGYVDFVSSLIKKNPPCYPGSPFIECSLALSGANLFFTELHKAEFEALRSNLASLLNHLPPAFAQIVSEDGFVYLKKHTPPAIKRGIILCDPSYEEKSDYIQASETLCTVHKKWSAAQILLWYPLLQNRADDINGMKMRLISAVKNHNANAEVLDASLCIDREDSHVETSLKDAIGSAKPRLYGSGLLVINPSWGLREALESALPFLADTLGVDANGSWSVEMR